MICFAKKKVLPDTINSRLVFFPNDLYPRFSGLIINGVYFNLVSNTFFWYKIYICQGIKYIYNGIKNNSLVSKLLQFGIFSK